MKRQCSRCLTRARVEIDLGALQRNGAALARRAGVPLLPMIKADAYGLGAEAAVRALEPLDPWGYGVATVREGEELRSWGVRRPDHRVSRRCSSATCRALRSARLTPTLGFADEIEAWRRGGGGAWHLAIDTGMSRAGIPWREIRRVVDAAARMPPQGAFTHFHSAELDDGTLAVSRSSSFARRSPRCHRVPRYLHADNSAAIAREGRSRMGSRATGNLPVRRRERQGRGSFSRSRSCTFAHQSSRSRESRGR